MAKVPKHLRAPGPIMAVLGAARMKRAIVALLILLACWGANEYVIWPQQGPLWASLVLFGIMVLHAVRLYIEIRDGLRHAARLSELRRNLREVELLGREAHRRRDFDVIEKCDARAHYLSEQHHFHLLGLRGELPLEDEGLEEIQ
jgi:hypothetical protein